MKWLVEWFARHSNAARLLVLCTIAGAFLSITHLPREIIPRTEADSLTVASTWPGASASTVANTLCTPLSNAILPLPGITQIRSNAINSQCLIHITLDRGTDNEGALSAITKTIAGIPLPGQATKPAITSTTKEPMVMRLGISGRAGDAILMQTAEHIASDLQGLGISKATVIEGRSRRLVVEVSIASLQQFQTSLPEIANALRLDAGSLPAGHVNNGGTSATLIVEGSYLTAEKLANLAIRRLPDGSQLRLADLASLREEYAGPRGRIDGEPSVAIAIYQGNNHSISDISRRVTAYIVEKRNTLPANVRLDIVFDNARFFNARMDYLQENFFSGLLISSLILFMWLRLRLAFWITTDIPIAFGGGLIWLYLMGGSLNVVSAFGLIIVLGIVCDDAIVIGENIHRHQSEGKPGLEGAIAGVSEMASTVVFAVATTIIMFVPLLFVPGSEGDLMRPLPMIIIAILLASLIEALLVLPSHLAHSGMEKLPSSGYAIAEKLDHFVIERYKPWLAAALQWRYPAVAACTAMFLVCITLVLSGRIPVEFFSAIDTEIATGSVAFPAGSNPALALEATDRIEQAALELRQELAREPDQPQITLVRSFSGRDATRGQVFLNLANTEGNHDSRNAIMQRWREKTGPVPGASELEFHSSVAVDSRTFSIMLTGNDAAMLEKASLALKTRLLGYSGVITVSDSFSQTLDEIRLQVRPEAINAGITRDMISTQLYMALEGMQVSTLNDGSSIMLQLPETERSSLKQLQDLPIRAGTLATMPLSSIATLQHARTQAAIVHHNGQPASFITAQLDEQQVNRQQLLAELQKDTLPQIRRAFPGVDWKRTGSLESENDVRDYFALSFILSLAAMFIMLATSLGSWLQPLMIFTAIPFGIVGALLGHLLTGQPLTLWSLAGMIAVSGIVVNNNMVIIFFINEKLSAGADFMSTVMEAGVRRFRPIMLTTITTFVGVFPTILNRSWEAQFLIPMAISIGFGVLFAAILTLFLVPCIYLISNDATRLLKVK